MDFNMIFTAFRTRFHLINDQYIFPVGNELGREKGAGVPRRERATGACKDAGSEAPGLQRADRSGSTEAGLVGL